MQHTQSSSWVMINRNQKHRLNNLVIYLVTFLLGIKYAEISRSGIQNSCQKPSRVISRLMDEFKPYVCKPAHSDLWSFPTSTLSDGDTAGLQNTRFATNFALLIAWEDFNLLKPTGHVMHQQFNIQHLYALPTLYLFICIYLRTNSDLCHLQHKLIGFYNRDEKCLLRGTNWVFK